MKRTFPVWLASACLVFSGAVPLTAELDIVKANGENEDLLYVLKNTETGKVLGTFWDRANERSDYGFDSSIVPDFFWSADRSYVAVVAGAARSRGISLYKVAGESLHSMEVPLLTDEQASPLSSISDVSAEGTDAVRWQEDGTLLLRFWAQGRVTSDTEEPPAAEVWAVVEVTGDKAEIVSTSLADPSAPAADAEGFDPNRLAGKHQVTGRNPNGTAYKGSVEIRVVEGVVELDWTIAGAVSHGRGALVGMTLGVALDDGLALYRVVGQAEGLSLIGIWAGAGGTTAGEDVILIGNADMTQAEFPVEKSNGDYVSMREVEDGQVEGNVAISGGEKIKKALWTVGEKTTKCQGLALGEGLAILTPTGVSVFEKHLYNDRNASLVGLAVSRKGEIQSETLSPAF
jgi:hypothetical protein